MKSVRGKCPNCGEIVLLDLDAPELACPYCKAVFKKTVKKKAPAPEAPVPPVPEEVAAPEETVKDVAAETVTPQAEAAVPEETISEEEAMAIAAEADESVADDMDIPSLDEEIEKGRAAEEEAAAEAPATEEAAAEEAPAEITEEELADAAAFDDIAEPEEIDVPETPAEEIAEEAPMASASIEDEEPAEEAAEEKEDAPEEEAEPLVNGNIEIDATAPAADIELTDDANAEPAAAEPVEAPEVAEPEIEVPEIEEITDDAPAATEEAPAEPAAADETPASEDMFSVEALLADTPKEDDSVARGYSDEDFAEAGADDVHRHQPTASKAVVKKATVQKVQKTAEKAEQDYKKEAKKIEKSERQALFARPVAIILFILAIAFVVFDFAYGLFVREPAYLMAITAEGIDAAYFVGAPALIGCLPETVIGTILGFLPIFGGEYFPLIITAVYYGIIALIAILGITGRRTRVPSIFLLLATIVLAMPKLWAMNGGRFFLIPFDGLAEILLNFGTYITYGAYGLLLIAAILYLAFFIRSKASHSFSFLAGLPALIYGLLVILGGAALVVLPMVLEAFVLEASLYAYILLGVWGVGLLLTLVGVHKGSLSRSANAYGVTFTMFAYVCLIAAAYALSMFEISAGMNYARLFALIPSVAGIFAAGFAIADVRN